MDLKKRAEKTNRWDGLELVNKCTNSQILNFGKVTYFFCGITIQFIFLW